MKVGDKIELWRRDYTGADIKVFPSNFYPEHLIILSIGYPREHLIKVGHYREDGRLIKESVFFIDPSRYSIYYGGDQIYYKGLTVEYHLDQVMDSVEDLL